MFPNIQQTNIGREFRFFQADSAGTKWIQSGKMELSARHVRLQPMAGIPGDTRQKYC